MTQCDMEDVVFWQAGDLGQKMLFDKWYWCC